MTSSSRHDQSQPPSTKPAADPPFLAGWPDTPTRWTGYDDYGRINWDVLVPNSYGDPETMARSYQFTPDGNVDSIMVWGSSNPADAGFQWFTYDSLGQLESWNDVNSNTTNYDYDKAGNRTQAGGTSYTYDEQNRLETAGTATYDWTDRGTLASVTDGSTTNYTFDAYGQALTVGAVTMTYDGLGRIATRDSDPFTYSGLDIDPIDDGDWTTHHSLDGTVLSTEETGGTNARWAVNDHRRNVVGLRDPSDGHVDQTTSFSPWGEPAATTGSLTPTVGYQGDYTDPTTNQVWMGARHYQPTTATFTSRDSYGGRLETPISLNRYTYAHNNPLTNWDPDGHFPKELEERLIELDTALRRSGDQKMAFMRILVSRSGASERDQASFLAVYFSQLVGDALRFRQFAINQWFASRPQFGPECRTDGASCSPSGTFYGGVSENFDRARNSGTKNMPVPRFCSSVSPPSASTGQGEIVRCEYLSTAPDPAAIVQIATLRAIEFAMAVAAGTNRPGPEHVERLAQDMVSYSRPRRKYKCGTTASGRDVICVEARRLPALQDADAVTYGHVVFCRSVCTQYLVQHEMAHVAQFERKGDIMGVGYILESMYRQIRYGAKPGYCTNTYEQEAYRAAGDYCDDYH